MSRKLQNCGYTSLFSFGFSVLFDCVRFFPWNTLISVLQIIGFLLYFTDPASVSSFAILCLIVLLHLIYCLGEKSSIIHSLNSFSQRTNSFLWHYLLNSHDFRWEIKDGFKYFLVLSIKRWTLLPLPLNLGWLCYLFWPIKCGRNGVE